MEETHCKVVKRLYENNDMFILLYLIAYAISLALVKSMHGNKWVRFMVLAPFITNLASLLIFILIGWLQGNFRDLLIMDFIQTQGIVTLALFPINIYTSTTTSK